MKNRLLKKIKEMFGKYESGYEYWIKLEDIEIQTDFLRKHPRHKKMEQKWKYYREYGDFESPIILNKDFVLENGYTSYLIAKTEGMYKVPVYFAD